MGARAGACSHWWQELCQAKTQEGQSLPDGVDALGVAGPGVDVLLGQIAVFVLLTFLSLGGLNPGPLRDGVHLVLAMEVGLLRDPGSSWLVLLCL